MRKGDLICQETRFGKTTRSCRRTRTSNHSRGSVYSEALSSNTTMRLQCWFPPPFLAAHDLTCSRWRRTLHRFALPWLGPAGSTTSTSPRSCPRRPQPEPSDNIGDHYHLQRRSCTIWPHLQVSTTELLVLVPKHVPMFNTKSWVGPYK